jgi:tetratricopeptide (TPR) repeat protein
MTAGLVLMLLQAAACSGEAGRLHAEGVRAAASLDVTTAVGRFEAAAENGCADARVAAIYLSAVTAAREAYRVGGSEESLQPVRRAEAALEALASRGDTLAPLVRLLVMAAAAAAQSERGEMDLLLTQAQQLERVRLAGGLSGVPGMSAHELAGDLWLQVHRFEAASAAYRQALDLVGPTPRTLLGLARTAARLDDVRAACEGYARLLREWRPPGTPGAIVEAREFVARQCPA